MKITTVFCDLCEQECDKMRFGVVSGCILKVNEKGQMGNMVFQGHYCEEDISKIIRYIEQEKLNKNAQHTNTTGVVEQVVQGKSDSGT